MLLTLSSLLALAAFGGCVAETGDIEGNARGGDRTTINVGSLHVAISLASDVELPDDVEAADFDCELVSDDGEVVNAVFEEESEGHFVLLVEELDSSKEWTLNVTPPEGVEIDRPTQNVTIVANEMKNVDINIVNVMIDMASLQVTLISDVDLPDDVSAEDFACELTSDAGEVVSGSFELDAEGNFVLVLGDLDPTQTWTLNVDPPEGIEIDQPTQEVTLEAGEMKNVDINITNVSVDG
jgi:hypothetical protein